jgi:thymidylate kinase
MIHFFGPDGAGKSTQVAKLASYLQDQGYKAKVAWVRSPHTAAYATMRLLYALGLRERLHNPSGREFSRPIVNQNSLSRFLWVVLELISAAPIVLKEAIVPSRRGQIVVAERYVLDTAATIGFFLQDERFIDTWPARLLYKLLLKDTLLVFLDADYDNVVARRGDIAEPQAFIDFQRRVYGKLAARMGATAIYTPSHGIEETHQMIVRMLTDGVEQNDRSHATTMGASSTAATTAGRETPAQNADVDAPQPRNEVRASADVALGRLA